MLLIKCGGAIEACADEVAADVASLIADGEQIVVVHGGSRSARTLGEQLQVSRRAIVSPNGVGSNYTDAAALDLLQLAWLGRVKPAVVQALLRRDVPAIGITGVDAAFVTAARKPALRSMVAGRPTIIRDDLSGRIQHVEPTLLRLLLENGYVPVVSPPVYDPDAGALNVDADRLAAALATTLHADALIILSGAPGVLADVTAPTSVIPRLVTPLGDELAVASDGMYRKLIAIADAVEAGIQRAVIASIERPHPVLRALANEGTVVERGMVPEPTG